MGESVEAWVKKNMIGGALREDSVEQLSNGRVEVERLSTKNPELDRR